MVWTGPSCFLTSGLWSVPRKFLVLEEATTAYTRSVILLFPCTRVMEVDSIQQRTKLDSDIWEGVK